MKKLFSLMLCLCLLNTILPVTALAETVEEEDLMESAAGYDFDFILRLHPDALSESLAKQAQGYADLLDALRFHGTYRWSLEAPTFDLDLSVIPVDSRAKPISIRFHGAEDLMFINSSLLGEQTIALRNSSLLNFCTKMSEHLGLPLHYLALMVPYVWTYSLGLPIQDWDGMVEKTDENGVIPAEAVQYLWDCWAYRVRRDEPTLILIDSLCKDTELEEAFRGMVSEIPDYFVKQVAQEQEIRILRKNGKTTWHAATGDFFTEASTDQTREISLNLPKMKTGYRPVFSLEKSQDQKRQSWRLQAKIISTNSLQEDLVNLEASLLSFPVSWPADFQSLLSLNLTGGLFPNIGFSVYMVGEKNGHARFEFRKPTVNYEPGPVMLTLEGDFNPLKGDVSIQGFTLDDLEGSLDLLVSNDTTIRAVLPNIIEPLLGGMFHFLVGIPTSACQTIMDDLTDLGVLDLLLGE